MCYYGDFEFQISSRKSKPIFDLKNLKNAVYTEGSLFFEKLEVGEVSHHKFGQPPILLRCDKPERLKLE
jgi:hypothetical protein